MPSTPKLDPVHMFRGFMPRCQDLSTQVMRTRLLTERAASMADVLSRASGGSLIRISNPAVQSGAGTSGTNLFNEYLEERKKSSAISVTNMFAQSDGDIYQLMSKEKTRGQIKQVWEFLMMDYWKGLLGRYSQACNITMTSPKPFWLEGNKLYMSREIGYISNKMHSHLALTRQAAPVTSVGEPLEISDSFALHLGALSRIKARENLFHGDYQLRHILFNPLGISSYMLYPPEVLEQSEIKIADIANKAFSSGISVIDVEGSILGLDGGSVEYENGIMYCSAIRNAYANGGKAASRTASRFSRYYRMGMDLVPPDFPVQTPSIIGSQHSRWGFSVDSPL